MANIEERAEILDIKSLSFRDKKGCIVSHTNLQKPCGTTSQTTPKQHFSFDEKMENHKME